MSTSKLFFYFGVPQSDLRFSLLCSVTYFDTDLTYLVTIYAYIFKDFFLRLNRLKNNDSVAATVMDLRIYRLIEYRVIERYCSTSSLTFI